MNLKTRQISLIRPVNWNASIIAVFVLLLVFSSFAGMLPTTQVTAAAADRTNISSAGVQPALQAWIEQHPTAVARVIVQANEATVTPADLVAAAGGTVIHELPMLHAVAAEIPSANVAVVAANPAVRWIMLDAQVVSAAEITPDWGFWGNGGAWGPKIVNNTYLATTNAWKARAAGLDGRGIGVAVIDSGIANDSDLPNLAKQIKFNPNTNYPNDNYGHGTHVAGIIGGNGKASNGVYQGVAPGVTLYGLKIADETGKAYESDTVAAMQWVLDNHIANNIRVVNLSINSTAIGTYSQSVLNAAVEILWFNGIVVVASSGNTKPGGATNPVQAAPANDPFVITVGASFEQGTGDVGDDSLAPYSAYGKTLDGHAKPDIVAPGTDIISVLASTSPWKRAYPDRLVMNGQYMRLSGTSMSAPIVTGAVALLLQDEPNLTPDQVKYRLTHTAQLLPGSDQPYLDVYAAVKGVTTESSNTGLAPSLLLAPAIEKLLGWNSVNWNSVNWNSVNWNSVNWNSVNWNSVNWNSVNWNSVNWNSVNWNSATVTEMGQYLENGSLPEGTDWETPVWSSPVPYQILIPSVVR